MTVAVRIDRVKEQLYRSADLSACSGNTHAWHRRTYRAFHLEKSSRYDMKKMVPRSNQIMGI
jgi:hypothetical protein